MIRQVGAEDFEKQPSGPDLGSGPFRRIHAGGSGVNAGLNSLGVLLIGIELG